MVSFRPTHYRIALRRFFARGAYRQEGPTGQSDLLARGAYWPEGPTGGLRGPQGEALAPVASPLATPLKTSTRTENDLILCGLFLNREINNGFRSRKNERRSTRTVSVLNFPF